MIKEITNPDWHMGLPYRWTYRPRFKHGKQHNNIYSINIAYKNEKWTWSVFITQSYERLGEGVEDSSQQAIAEAKILLINYFSLMMHSLYEVDFPVEKEESIKKDKFKHLVVHYSKYSVDKYYENENREEAFKKILEYAEQAGEDCMTSEDVNLLEKVKNQELEIIIREQLSATTRTATQDIMANRVELLKLTEW